ncbi:MAG: 3-oxoacyl-ACP synthase [Actinomycetota bacterium]|nr:3-oxoacyl-ACP synthase [Actinomycetota bacterium]
MPYGLASEPRTAICGVGAVTGYGWGVDALWSGVLSGRSAVVPVTVDGSTYLAARPPSLGSRDDHPSRYGQALFGATREAVADARKRGWVPGARVGLIGAGSLGDVEYRRSYLGEHNGCLRNRDYLGLMPSTAPAMLLRDLGFSGGPVMNIQAACAATNVALVMAHLWLAAGMATDVIVAASDFSAVPEDVAQFARMGALARDGDPLDLCRPFQAGSTGFVVGEAAATLILSARADEPYGMVLGGATAHDPYHPIAINPDCAELVNTFEGALVAAGVHRSEVSYLYTHGTGTAQNDAAEIEAAEKVLESDITFVATKPLTGHCQGASAGVEAVLTALSFTKKMMPSVTPVATPYHALAVGTSPRRDGLILKSALGMGGFNSAVVFSPTT